MSGVWYGFYIPGYGGIGMELIYYCGMGCPLSTLNQGIDVPHRYPKMGDLSATPPPLPLHLTMQYIFDVVINLCSSIEYTAVLSVQIQIP